MIVMPGATVRLQGVLGFLLLSIVVSILQFLGLPQKNLLVAPRKRLPNLPVKLSLSTGWKQGSKLSHGNPDGKPLARRLWRHSEFGLEELAGDVAYRNAK